MAKRKQATAEAVVLGWLVSWTCAESTNLGSASSHGGGTIWRAISPSGRGRAVPNTDRVGSRVRVLGGPKGDRHLVVPSSDEGYQAAAVADRLP